MCQCYVPGGPFIEEDPDCPIHGSEAQCRDRALREDMEAEEQSREDLEKRVESLEEQVSELQSVIEAQGQLLTRIISQLNTLPNT